MQNLQQIDWDGRQFKSFGTDGPIIACKWKNKEFHPINLCGARTPSLPCSRKEVKVFWRGSANWPQN
ncbi:hypothetical protein TNCV_1759451 [Trichonephila clavipes]|nr:hypothetical protein TNCV_1759451 [Trichonephila clavipes]